MKKREKKDRKNLYLGLKRPGELSQELPDNVTEAIAVRPIRFRGSQEQIREVAEMFGVALDAAVAAVNVKCAGRGNVEFPNLGSREALMALEETLPIYRVAHEQARAQQARDN